MAWQPSGKVNQAVLKGAMQPEFQQQAHFRFLATAMQMQLKKRPEQYLADCQGRLQAAADLTLLHATACDHKLPGEPHFPSMEQHMPAISLRCTFDHSAHLLPLSVFREPSNLLEISKDQGHSNTLKDIVSLPDRKKRLEVSDPIFFEGLHDIDPLFRQPLHQPRID